MNITVADSAISKGYIQECVFSPKATVLMALFKSDLRLVEVTREHIKLYLVLFFVCVRVFRCRTYIQREIGITSIVNRLYEL